MEVVLLFTGLIGFVPDKPLIPGPSNQIQATLVNATSASPPHVAAILVHRDFVNLPSTTRPHNQVTENSDFLRFDFDGERVVLRPRPTGCADAGCLVAVKDLVGDGDRVCPTPSNRRDLFWLGAMNRIHPGKGKMRKDCQRQPQNARNLVAGHVILDHGELSVADFGRFPDDQIIRWEIDRPSDDFEQALGDLVELKAHIGDDTAILQFLKFQSGSWQGDAGRIVLNSSLITPDSPVVVEIKNVPEADLCRQEPGTASPREPDIHYNYLYRLLQQPPNFEAPEPECPCPKLELAPYLLCNPGFVRVNDPQCPVGFFVES